MNQGHSPQTIAEAWRETLDLSLETGESPVFSVDALAGGLAGVHTAVALALLDAQRSDLTAPSLAIGGASPEWLAALWHERPDSAPRRTPHNMGHATVGVLPTPRQSAPVGATRSRRRKSARGAALGWRNAAPIRRQQRARWLAGLDWCSDCDCLVIDCVAQLTPVTQLTTVI